MVTLAVMGSNVLEFATVALRSGNTTLRAKAEQGLRTIHRENPQVRQAARVCGRASQGGCPLHTLRCVQPGRGVHASQRHLPAHAHVLTPLARMLLLNCARR